MHSYLSLALAIMVTANLWLPSLRTRLIEPLRQMGGQEGMPDYDLRRWREAADS